MSLLVNHDSVGWVYIYKFCKNIHKIRQVDDLLSQIWTLNVMQSKLLLYHSVKCKPGSFAEVHLASET